VHVNVETPVKLTEPRRTCCAVRPLGARGRFAPQPAGAVLARQGEELLADRVIDPSTGR
jgi:hypothetical protein